MLYKIRPETFRELDLSDTQVAQMSHGYGQSMSGW